MFVRTVITSLAELELWLQLGEWPREGPGQSSNINHENMHIIRPQVKCFCIVHDLAPLLCLGLEIWAW